MGPNAEAGPALHNPTRAEQRTARIMGAWFLGNTDKRLAEASLVPPLFLSVPAVFLFTFLAAGLRRAWTADRSDLVWIVLSGLSTVVLVGVVSWVVLAQTATWSIVVASNPNLASGPMVLFQLAQLGLGSRELPQHVATPVPLLAVMAAMAATAVIGMDRLRIRIGPAWVADR